MIILVLLLDPKAKAQEELGGGPGGHLEATQTNRRSHQHEAIEYIKSKVRDRTHKEKHTNGIIYIFQKPFIKHKINNKNHHLSTPLFFNNPKKATSRNIPNRLSFAPSAGRRPSFRQGPK